MVPISREIVMPVATSNILFVNSIEEFEKIELAYNETKLALDNFKECFYTRSRDKYGEYSATKVYFYQDFATKMQSEDTNAFYEKCKALRYDRLHTEIAEKFFVENEKPMNVWLWLLNTKKADWEYDTVKRLKCTMKKAFLTLE